jgi:hypothetical protein
MIQPLGPLFKTCVNSGESEVVDMDKDIVLSCGREVKRIREQNTGSLDFTADPVVLARVVIDTRRLNKPMVKIDFSTFIDFFTPTGNTLGAVFDFELRRKCDGIVETLKTYQYIVRMMDGDIESNGFHLRDTFGFTFCDKDRVGHKECCIYTVELLKIDVIGEEIEEEIIIEDSSIRAIAQGICS